MSQIKDFLARVDMFNGLSDEELSEVAALCSDAAYKAGQTILSVKGVSDKVYLVRKGTVQIIANLESGEEETEPEEAVLVTLGEGQSFGEMGLVDRGARSATVRATSNAEVYVMNCDKFLALCNRDTHVGFLVMRNIAADLSFKLRYRNLI